MMPHLVSATAVQTAAAEVLHMPTNPLAASGTFLKNTNKQSHAARVKMTKISFYGE